jgi:hypothetical protein
MSDSDCNDTACCGSRRCGRILHCIFHRYALLEIVFVIIFALALYNAINGFANDIVVPIISWVGGSFFGGTNMFNWCEPLSYGKMGSCRDIHGNIDQTCQQRNAAYFSSTGGMTCDQITANGGNTLNWGRWLSTLIHLAVFYCVFRCLKHLWCQREFEKRRRNCRPRSPCGNRRCDRCGTGSGGGAGAAAVAAAQLRLLNAGINNNNNNNNNVGVPLCNPGPMQQQQQQQQLQQQLQQTGILPQGTGGMMGGGGGGGIISGIGNTALGGGVGHSSTKNNTNKQPSRRHRRKQQAAHQHQQDEEDDGGMFSVQQGSDDPNGMQADQLRNTPSEQVSLDEQDQTETDS